MKKRKRRLVTFLLIVAMFICGVYQEEVKASAFSIHTSDEIPLSSESLRKADVFVRTDMIIGELASRRNVHQLLQIERKHSKRNGFPCSGFYLLEHCEDAWGETQDESRWEALHIWIDPAKDIICYIHNQDGEK